MQFFAVYQERTLTFRFAVLPELIKRVLLDANDRKSLILGRQAGNGREYGRLQGAG
jgi:hypothetical protein